MYMSSWQDDQARLNEACRLVLTHMTGEAGPTCDELWEEFWAAEASTIKTSARSELAWRTARPWFGHLRVAQVTEAHVDMFKRARREKVTVGTLNRDLIVLRRMFRWALERRKIPRIPLVVLEPYDVVRQTKIRDEKTLRQLLYQCSPLMRALVLVLFDGGLRRGEALGLRRDQIERKPDGGAVIRLAKTKNGCPRRPHITRRALEALDALPAVGEYYFSNPETRRPYNERHICRMFERAVARSGLRGVDGEHITLHTLRHSFAYVRRVRDHWPESRVMAAGGWKTSVAFRRYGIVDEEEMSEAYVGVEDRIENETAPRTRAPKNDDAGNATPNVSDGEILDE